MRALSDRDHYRLTPDFALARRYHPRMSTHYESLSQAAAALYLSSEEAGFVTGQVLRVNGGLYV